MSLVKDSRITGSVTAGADILSPDLIPVDRVALYEIHIALDQNAVISVTTSDGVTTNEVQYTQLTASVIGRLQLFSNDDFSYNIRSDTNANILYLVVFEDAGRVT